MHNRRGVSLIEVMVAISVGGVMLSIGVMTLRVLLRTERTGARHLLQSTTRARVSELFRRDLHEAVAAQPFAPAGDEPSRFELTFPDGRQTVYQFADGHLQRLESEAGKLAHRDDFLLPDAELAFELQPGPPRLASLLIREERGTKTESAASRVFRIDAVLARNHRYESPAPQPKTDD
jgi:prepilin-type N-terminal cleavage/methylation domain-containing protein